MSSLPLLTLSTFDKILVPTTIILGTPFIVFSRMKKIISILRSVKTTNVGVGSSSMGSLSIDTDLMSTKLSSLSSSIITSTLTVSEYDVDAWIVFT